MAKRKRGQGKIVPLGRNSTKSWELSYEMAAKGSKYNKARRGTRNRCVYSKQGGIKKYLVGPDGVVYRPHRKGYNKDGSLRQPPSDAQRAHQAWFGRIYGRARKGREKNDVTLEEYKRKFRVGGFSGNPNAYMPKPLPKPPLLDNLPYDASGRVYTTDTTSTGERPSSTGSRRKRAALNIKSFPYKRPTKRQKKGLDAYMPWDLTVD